MAAIVCEKNFALKRGEVTAFAADVTSSVSCEALLKFEGLGNAVCLYCEGKDYLGKPFVKTAKLEAGKPKRLWCLISASENEAAGKKEGTVSLVTKDGKVLASEKLNITVTSELADDSQFENPAEMKRLAWLNSDYAIDKSIPKPYTPITLSGNRISVLGRELFVGSLGLPEKISTYYTEDIRLSDKETAVLSSPISFTANGESFESKSLKTECDGEGVDIISVNESCHFTLDIKARVEFDGYASYKMKLCAKSDIDVSDAALSIPVKPECTKYFMGLGKEGGYFDRELDFKWSSERHQDNFWCGAVNAGLRLKFTGDNYTKPLVNIYYSQKPMAVPESWGNGDEGGIKFDSENSVFTVYSGKRKMKKGESLSYNFDLIITPLKPIDYEKSFGMRFFHRPPEAKIDIENRRDAKIVNIHHGNDMNPYINYPFFENEALREFIKNAHGDGLLVKVYYTIRELTIMTPEFKAFRDFDYEIFEKAGNSASSLWQDEARQWIKENIGDDLIPAWRQKLFGDKYFGTYDSSVITDGQSRLCNFYIEGLRYLVEHMEIDGLYIDDLAYDRNTMKRVRRTIDKRPKAYIDFHTWNHYTARAAFSNSINLYMELLPYIDKAWIGEGFDYDMPADHWLVAISGIPFGLMSEMMCEGQPWRGLAFGMTTRLGWVPEADPTNIWELFDKYGLEKSTLLGFWDKRNTVKCDNPAVVATLYKTADKTFIHLANWTNEDQNVNFTVDGMEFKELYVPAVRDFQEEAILGRSLNLGAGKAIFAELV